MAVLSWLLSFEERETLQYASHLYCSTPPICTAVLLEKYWGLGSPERFWKKSPPPPQKKRPSLIFLSLLFTEKKNKENHQKSKDFSSQTNPSNPWERREKHSKKQGILAREKKTRSSKKSPPPPPKKKRPWWLKQLSKVGQNDPRNVSLQSCLGPIQLFRALGSKLTDSEYAQKKPSRLEKKAKTLRKKRYEIPSPGRAMRIQEIPENAEKRDYFFLV